MAVNKIDWPTASTPIYTPDIETDYNNQNENLERVIKGYNAVSLTNWDATTTASQVASGSVVESNGVLYDVTVNTTIGTSGATSGTIYLTFDDSALAFEWVDTAPTWIDALNGWYISGDRFTGHICTWDGATSFSIKHNYQGNTQSDGNVFLYNDGGLFSDWGGTYGTQSISIGSDWTIPLGAYSIASTTQSLALEIYNGSAWVNGGLTGLSGFIVSDGSSYKVKTLGAAETIYYLKIW